MKYKDFAKKLDLELHHNELKKALTHKSFYKGREEKGNSRYIFFGMYSFKGKVAELLFEYFPMDGTLLQHYLGNIFKEDILIKIFDKYKLKKYIRHDIDFDSEKYKHIFVYAFLGFIFKYEKPEKINKFIIDNFLIETAHLIPDNFKNNDTLAQCNYFTMLVFGENAKLKTFKNPDNTFTASVYAGNNILHEISGKSYKYSRKKVLKETLIILAEKLAKDHFENPVYQQFLVQQQEQEIIEIEKNKVKKEKLRTVKLEKKKALRDDKKLIKIENAKIQDQNRRKVKQAAKQRLERLKEKEIKKAAAIANMSGKKRRHIDDKNK